MEFHSAGRGASAPVISVARLPLAHPLRVLVTLVAMVGLRLDRPLRQIIWSLLGVVTSVTLACTWTDLRLSDLVGGSPHRPLAGRALGYVIAVWIVYYVGHVSFYVFGLNRSLRQRLGPDAAYTVYSIVLGVVYFNAVFCQLPLIASMGGTLDLPLTPAQLFAVSAGLLIVSFGIKVWATLLLGIDAFYYRDMLMETRGEGGRIVRGPYRFFRDPIYSVGYLPVYAGALLAQSTAGLVAGFAFHVGIFLFNHIAERPFVARVYGSRLDESVLRQ